jgi:hypothetical protein
VQQRSLPTALVEQLHDDVKNRSGRDDKEHNAESVATCWGYRRVRSTEVGEDE